MYLTSKLLNENSQLGENISCDSIWANVSVVLKVGVVASFEGHRKERILGAYRDILKNLALGYMVIFILWKWSEMYVHLCILFV